MKTKHIENRPNRRALVAEGDAYLTGQGIRNPTAWSRMYAPGFEDR